LSWALSLDFLDVELVDLFLYLLKLLLLLVSHFLGLVVLLLDLSKLERDFSNLVLLILVGSRVICWLKKSGSFHVFRSTIIDLKLLGHH
jgi:hypothetical protein